MKHCLILSILLCALSLPTVSSEAQTLRSGKTKPANKTASKNNSGTRNGSGNSPRVLKRTSDSNGLVTTETIHYSDGRIVTVTRSQCFACRGRKSCQACGGSGQQAYPYGMGACGMCYGNKGCQACQGKGENVVTTVTQNGTTGSISPNGPVRHVGGSTTTGSRRPNKGNSRYGKKDCTLCRGTGTCRSCGGNGHLNGNLNTPSASCPNCLGHTTGKMKDYGRCKPCKGSGKRYGIK